MRGCVYKTRGSNFTLQIIVIDLIKQFFNVFYKKKSRKPLSVRVH